jgi:hypothetical protein
MRLFSLESLCVMPVFTPEVLNYSFCSHEVLLHSHRNISHSKSSTQTLERNGKEQAETHS